jgi:hypothetical protein
MPDREHAHGTRAAAVVTLAGLATMMKVSALAALAVRVAGSVPTTTTLLLV